jgi:gliding motility-associated-like protein
MKRTGSLLLLLFCFTYTFASHIVGGEMTYEYLGPGSSSNSSQYRITLKLFRDEHCSSCAAMPGNVFIGIFSNDDKSQYPQANQPYDVRKLSETGIPVEGLPPCINNPPDLDYHVALYTLTVDLPNNQYGYTATYQTCCRISPLTNVYNVIQQAGGGGTGSTYSCIIPGVNQLGANNHNSSPAFATAISVICQGKPFTLDFSAKDADGDSLAYYFCEAYDGGAARGANNINPAPPSGSTLPQYNAVQYINGFTGSTPLGNRTSINPKTGIISGIAPGIGEYVVCVCLNEYRGGKLIGFHRKDFIINVNDCDFAGAQLLPSYLTCDQFSYTFQNQNTSTQNHTFFWDAGVAGTSNTPSATFTFPDTGLYNIKLVINRGEPCSDSTTSQVKVYPGFIPNFTFSGICVNKPTLFKDSTVAKYGSVNSWTWDFGNTTVTNDVSTAPNPSYTYSKTGTYNVTLIATSTKGCIDTIVKNDVTIIDKPPLRVSFRDTLICNGDALQLQALGSGNFSWTPATSINNGNTATPTVTPNITTKYFVQLDDNGCLNRDSVRVRVVDFVTLQARTDTVICSADSVRLSAVSDGLKFVWSPSSSLSNPNIINPLAIPASSTTYQITASIGHCNAQDDVAVKTIPYPVALAGNDTTICYGTTAQLNGSMKASSFTWTPSASLTSSNTLAPVARPVNSTAYVLTVRDTLGCPKPGRDTVLITVLPKINAFAGRDTAVIAGQSLQFNASGGVSYIWSPGTSLSSTNIPNPVGNYDGSFDAIQYKVIVANQIGCIDSALVSVRIFKTDPYIFVPSAFTPNGDAKNDLFRPIAVGINRIEYFRVFNRWGQMVFSTTVNGQGWDGKIGGKEQSSGTYVWLVKGVDFTGKDFFAKGTVVLIR